MHNLFSIVVLSLLALGCSPAVVTVSTDDCETDVCPGDADIIGVPPDLIEINQDTQPDTTGDDSTTSTADDTGTDTAVESDTAVDEVEPEPETEEEPEPDVCTPNCAGRCAGAADDCGGQCNVNDCPAACCGTTCCSVGQVCDQNQSCCQPRQCAVECGQSDDGCGHGLDCGGCNNGQVCVNGVCTTPPADCSGIRNHPSFELCEEGQNTCAGVFTNGEGCAAFCAAANMQCTARYGGEPGCQLELHNPLTCHESNGHMSDWCECSGGGVVDPNCEVDPGNPPQQREKHYSRATFQPRSSWVLECRDYAYTAQYDEHEACDSQYRSGSGRGTATFTFNVNRGRYSVYIEGRHTTNRNSAGALVIVNSNGQSHRAVINQRDDGGMVFDLHGTYCLDGAVEVIMDSTVSSASDSIRSVRLTPAN